MTELLRVQDVDVVLGRHKRASQILSDVSLRVDRGEVVGVVGETGSGKTTLARTIVGLIDPVRGTVTIAGEPVSTLRGAARRAARRRGRVQLVFQDPLRSLDPDLTIGRVVGEGLAIRGDIPPAEIADRARQALTTVGLDPDLTGRYPTEVSGGQRQRVAIARALIMRPDLLICDEPVSALDASNRNRVLRLLGELRGSLGVGMIVISHDLGSLACIADRIVVLYRGRVVEQGPTGEVFGAPRHPYTALLVASALNLSRQRPLRPTDLLRSDTASPAPGHGCVFADRCRFATGECQRQPALTEAGAGQVACHHHDTWRDLVSNPSVSLGEALPR